MAVFICQACGAEHSVESGKCPECGATQTIRLKIATDRMVDKVIKGKYKIIRKLGQGGMGAVYLAEQMGIGHRVALKFLKSEFSSDAEIARRFLNEAKSYARVAHPNAVTLHDFGQDEEGNLFIAMEYCEGVDLKKVISEQRQLPVAEAIEVVLQVADVLANAHAKGVVHRDLKPENIMIRRGMRGVHAKVLDFGIARLMDAGTRLTMAGAIAGTPRYMSPEQVEGREADLRADIYSLGIVLFETLTGVQPFDGNTIAEILRRQVAEPMPRLVEASPELDFPELDMVIQKATAKNRDLRWPDMLTFADALAHARPQGSQASVPVLQRSGMSRVNATPAPGSTTSASGMAMPGMPITDLEMSGETMLKASPMNPTPAPSPSRPRIGPPPSTLQAGLGTELEGHGRPSNVSLLPVAPAKSKAPMVAAGLVALALVGGGVWALTRQATIATVDPVVTPVIAHDPQASTDAGEAVVVPAPPPDPNATLAVAREGVRLMAEQSGRSALSFGRTAFELAKLDEAETNLKSIEKETSSFTEGQEILGKINRIRERLVMANSLRNRGDCPRALVAYQEVLRINSKVADAITGASGCKAAAVAPTMDP